MKKALKSKASVVVIFVSKVHGLGRFELYLGIMKDMKPHTLNLLPDIISVVMVAEGGQSILTFHKTQFVVSVSFFNYRLDNIQIPVIFTTFLISLILYSRDKDGYYWLTGRVDDVINVR